MLYKLYPSTEGTEDVGKFAANGTAANHDDIFEWFFGIHVTKETLAGVISYILYAFHGRNLGFAAGTDENFISRHWFTHRAISIMHLDGVVIHKMSGAFVYIGMRFI